MEPTIQRRNKELQDGVQPHELCDLNPPKIFIYVEFKLQIFVLCKRVVWDGITYREQSISVVLSPTILVDIYAL